jgi:hypothetical protein
VHQAVVVDESRTSRGCRHQHGEGLRGIVHDPGRIIKKHEIVRKLVDDGFVRQLDGGLCHLQVGPPVELQHVIILQKRLRELTENGHWGLKNE